VYCNAGRDDTAFYSVAIYIYTFLDSAWRQDCQYRSPRHTLANRNVKDNACSGLCLIYNSVYPMYRNHTLYLKDNDDNNYYSNIIFYLLCKNSLGHEVTAKA
jgi:hypothetical protein